MNRDTVELREQIRRLREQAAKLDEAIAAIERLDGVGADAERVVCIDRSRQWPRRCA